MSKVSLTSTFLCLFLLSGCSWLGDWPDSSDDKSSGVRIVQPDESMYASLERRGLKMPPKQDSAQGMAMLPPLSNDVQQEALMQPVETQPNAVEQRIERLEASVLQIHEALERMQPALQRLAGLEVSLESLIGQIEPAAGGAPQGYTEIPQGYTEYVGHTSAAPQQPQDLVPLQKNGITQNDMAPPLAPIAPLAPVEPNIQQASVSSSYGGFVNNVRVGEHPGKTRLVLDVSDSLAFDVRKENGGRVLVVDLPTAGWRTSPLLQVSNSPLIESFASQTNGQGGVRFTVQLKRDVQILWAEGLKPSGIQGHRIVIDLAAI